MTITHSPRLVKSDLTVIPLFTNDNFDKVLKLFFDSFVIDWIKQDFRATEQEQILIYSKTLGRVLLLGLGHKNKLTLSLLRKQLQSVGHVLHKYKAENLQLILPHTLSNENFVEICSFALVFASYRFDHYLDISKRQKPLSQLHLVTTKNNRQIKSAIALGRTVALATNNSRDLANHPANIATPKHLAMHAKTLAKQTGMQLQILDEKQIAKEKLGLLEGVSRGSDEPPRLIILDYGPKNQQPIVLVGKGLTFDSGGVSIKPSERLDEMKYDMCGGAAVLGIMEAVSKLKLKQRIVGIIPASENLLSGRALKPGDVLHSHSGKTVEITNTDAEGRLILADGISYALKYYKPKAIIDYATLTGAVIVALGNEYTGTMFNTDKFARPVAYASEVTGEKTAILPLAKEYQTQLKSSIADLKNLGEKGLAGAITAGLFLESFVQQIPWLHLDTAGTSWTTKPTSSMPLGATGWGVYFTVKLLSKLKL